LQRSYAVISGSGGSHATLSFNCASLSLGAAAGNGTALGQTSGPSIVTLSVAVPAGNDKWTVSGKGKCTFTLTVTTPSP
jgi:hypothetical protein